MKAYIYDVDLKACVEGSSSFQGIFHFPSNIPLSPNVFFQANIVLNHLNMPSSFSERLYQVLAVRVIAGQDTAVVYVKEHHLELRARVIVTDVDAYIANQLLNGKTND